jgi:acyl-CoA reductase-like NAD-dependent aldehyde dehydrogenase
MAFKITFSIETPSPKERDAILDRIAELCEDYEYTIRKVALSDEAKTLHGKQAIKADLTFDPGETMDFSDLGIVKLTPMDRALRLERADAH